MACVEDGLFTSPSTYVAVLFLVLMQGKQTECYPWKNFAQEKRMNTSFSLSPLKIRLSVSDNATNVYKVED